MIVCVRDSPHFKKEGAMLSQKRFSVMIGVIVLAIVMASARGTVSRERESVVGRSGRA